MTDILGDQFQISYIFPVAEVIDRDRYDTGSFISEHLAISQYFNKE